MGNRRDSAPISTTLRGGSLPTNSPDCLFTRQNDGVLRQSPPEYRGEGTGAGSRQPHSSATPASQPRRVTCLTLHWSGAEYGSRGAYSSSDAVGLRRGCSRGPGVVHL